jgi:putative PIG3 family NAD(P)H quinone oxidoreductase
MRAIVIGRPGGPEVLELRDLKAPDPSRGEVRIRVHAAGVNRADLLQRMGAYPAPPDVLAEVADVPGLEFAGTVDALGEGAVGWAVGDRVFGLAGGGAYAEFLVVHARALAKMPDGLSFHDAAAVPEAFITAYDAMITQAGLTAGDTVLVHAVASGVGTAAVQIARAIGARSIGTSRTEAKLSRAAELGMNEGIVAKAGRFADGVLSANGGRGVDVTLELVGGDYLSEDLRCAAERARIVLVGLLSGARAEIDLGLLLRKRISLIGTMLRSRPVEEKIDVMQRFARHVVPLLASGSLVPVVERVLPLDRAAEAHAYMAGGEGFGKIVLAVA